MTPPDDSAVTVQCSTGPFWTFELAEAFASIADAGFTEIELMVTRDPQTQSPEIPARLAKEHGLRISAVHGPFLVLTKTVWGTDPLEKIRRGTAMCQELGSSTLVVHPPYLWEQQYAGWLRAEAEDHAAATGVRVAVETMYPKWVGARRIRIYRFLDPRDLFGACRYVALDTSHLTVAREDIFDAYRLLAPKLVHIHLSNNADDGRDGHLGLDEGVLPLDRFLQEVKGTGYSGAVSLELTVRGFLERPSELVTMLRQNREFIEQQLTPGPTLAEDLPKG